MFLSFQIYSIWKFYMFHFLMCYLLLPSEHILSIDLLILGG